ncbi:hypothetical protein MMC30_005064 [Trapelia coarctata]|nr:hypothetical protein [Trapelia coarctata]
MFSLHARTTFHSHPSPLLLHPKPPPPSSPPDPKPTTPLTLLSLAQSSTPPCALNPLLFNGHLQTIWTATRSYDIPIYYKRHIFSAEDPAFAGTFAVDFVVQPYEPSSPDTTLPPRTTCYEKEEYDALGSDDEKPMLVVLHGLSGGSHEIYLRAVLEPLVNAGWEACVVNSRGCAMSKITTGVLYNARATWDIRQVVKWCRERWPKRGLYGIGFSLGANIMVNYLGEEGEGCLLNAAVVASNPWNLDIGAIALQRSWIGMEIYSKTMGASMKKLFEEHAGELMRNSRVDMEKVRNIKYLHEFDRDVQGPTWGYPTEGAYYRDASSADSVLAVRIPLFAIHAEDDPIAAMEAVPVEEIKQTPYVVLCTTSVGGHLSWFEVGGGRWFAKPASQFLIKFAEEIDRVEPPAVPVGEATHVGEPGQYAPCFLPMRRKLRLHSE